MVAKRAQFELQEYSYAVKVRIKIIKEYLVLKSLTFTIQMTL